MSNIITREQAQTIKPLLIQFGYEIRQKLLTHYFGTGLRAEIKKKFAWNKDKHLYYILAIYSGQRDMIAYFEEENIVIRTIYKYDGIHQSILSVLDLLAFNRPHDKSIVIEMKGNHIENIMFAKTKTRELV